MREHVLEELQQQTPREYGLGRTRWSLADFIGSVPGVGCRSGVWRVFRRLGIRYRRGWAHLVSPDPLTQTKLEWLAAIQERVGMYPEQAVLLWLDELTFYRLPSLAPTWDAGSRRAMKARMRPGNNTCARVVGALNASTGQVEVRLRSEIGVRQLQQFYQQVRAAYPQAEEIYVVQDCWPVHFLPEVVQTACACGITLVPLPTYSSWRNPIEKLWRWLKQAVIHMHRWADDWPQLKQTVQAFLDQFHQPSPALLRYVGLPN
jgi:DDE superfamily endonuclease